MELLFKSGNAHLSYPLKMVVLETPTALQFPAQAMFVAPKRSFKKSPDRNVLKRRMREAYRLNKSLLYETLNVKNKKLILAFIYTGKKIGDYAQIESAVLNLIKTLTKD